MQTLSIVELAKNAQNGIWVERTDWLTDRDVDVLVATLFYGYEVAQNVHVEFDTGAGETIRSTFDFAVRNQFEPATFFELPHFSTFAIHALQLFRDLMVRGYEIEMNAFKTDPTPVHIEMTQWMPVKRFGKAADSTFERTLSKALVRLLLGTNR